MLKTYGEGRLALLKSVRYDKPETPNSGKGVCLRYMMFRNRNMRGRV